MHPEHRQSRGNGDASPVEVDASRVQERVGKTRGMLIELTKQKGARVGASREILTSVTTVGQAMRQIWVEVSHIAKQDRSRLGRQSGSWICHETTRAFTRVRDRNQGSLRERRTES
jgi:hypothetical protein